MDEHEKSVAITVEPTAALRTTLSGKATMTAARFHGQGDIRLDTLEEPQCNKGEVKVYITTFPSIILSHAHARLNQ